MSCVAGAPRKTWGLLQGERPCRARNSQPPVPSVGVITELKTKEVNNNRNSEQDNVSVHREACGPQWKDAPSVKRLSSVTARSRGDGVSKPEASKEDTAMTWSLESAGVEERGTHAERHPRTWETHAGVRRRTSANRSKSRARDDGTGVRSLHSTPRRESRSHGEGSDRIAQPAKET
jgi:hypothetical protein